MEDTDRIVRDRSRSHASLTWLSFKARDRSAWPWVASLCVYLVLAALTFGVQLAYHGFLMNDHAGYLAMARQVVLGGLPIRDFLDHGTFLHVLVSAALQWAFGHRMLAEMLLCYGMIALGYCFTYRLTSSLARSNVVGFLLTLSCVLTAARPYSYPKIAIYPIAIYLMWRYVRHVSSRNLAVLGLASAIALMVRVDHGVVVLSAAAMIVALRHLFDSRSQALRSVGLLMRWFVAGLVPFLVYLAFSGGIVHHFVTIFEFGGRALAQSDWFGLHVLGLAPGATGAQVAAAWIHDSYVVLTVVAIGALAWRMVQEVRVSGSLGVLSLQLLATVAVWAIAAPMLVRDIFIARFPDVGPILAILAAGIVATMSGPLRDGSVLVAMTGGHRRIGFWLRGATSVGVVVLLLVPATLIHGGPLGVVSAYQRARRDSGAIYDNFVASPPRDVIAIHREVARYASECTKPSDHLLVTWFAPEIYFGANRRFAGNQWVYVNYQNSTEEQRRVVRQIQGQSIPLVFARPGDSMFAGFWPLLADYIESEFVEVGVFDGAIVYANRRKRPVRTSAYGNLPCFAEAPPR